jgi:hypothetical protein
MNVNQLPRVKPEDLEAQVKEVNFYREGVLTICVLTTHNGFKLVGESACAHPDLYNQELGEKIARANALNKLWPLLGYQLRDQLFVREEATFLDRLRGEYKFVADNVKKLRAMMGSPRFTEFPEDTQEDMKVQYEAMIPYMEILHKRLLKLEA